MDPLTAAAKALKPVAAVVSWPQPIHWPSRLRLFSARLKVLASDFLGTKLHWDFGTVTLGGRISKPGRSGFSIASAGLFFMRCRNNRNPHPWR